MKILSLIFRKKCQTFLCCPPHEGRASLYTQEIKRAVGPRKGIEPPATLTDSCCSEWALCGVVSRQELAWQLGRRSQERRHWGHSAPLTAQSMQPPWRREEHPQRKAAPSKNKESQAQRLRVIRGPYRVRLRLSPTRSTPLAASGAWRPGQLSHRGSSRPRTGVLSDPGNGWSSGPAGCQHWWPGTGLRHRPHPGWTGSPLPPPQTQAGPLWKRRAAPSLSRSSHDLRRHRQEGDRSEPSSWKTGRRRQSQLFLRDIHVPPPERNPLLPPSSDSNLPYFTKLHL